MVNQPLYKKHFYLSLLLHLLLLFILVASIEFKSSMPVVNNSDKPEVINALVMDVVEKEPKVVVQKPIPTPPAPPKPVAPPIPKPPAKPEIVEKEPPVKTQPIVIPDKQKIQEELIQKKLLEELQAQKEQNKKKKQKALQTEFEKELAEMKAKSLQNQMLQEQQRLANLRAAQMKGVVDKYKALILQAIGQHWIVPPNVNKKRYAELLIRVAPGGVVMDVQLMKSSGDEGLDRSARTAVFKASPLPVPSDSDSFDAFRQFVLKVKPENIVSNGA